MEVLVFLKEKWKGGTSACKLHKFIKLFWFFKKKNSTNKV